MTDAETADLIAQVQRLQSALDASNRELASLTYSISHDLRSPLRAIQGFSEALLEDYRDALDDVGLDYLNRVQSAVERMELLIQKLLELARVSRAELKIETVNISQIAQSIVSELAQSAPERNVTFTIEPDIVVEADAALTRTAFEQLLGNSWKFTRNHSTASIQVESETRDGQRVISIHDDGAGFDPAYAARLFGPFQRCHSASEFEGAGIGLALVQRIANRHGWTVTARGQVEQGMTFRIELP